MRVIIAALALTGCVPEADPSVSSLSRGLVSIPATTFTMGRLEPTDPTMPPLLKPHTVTLDAFQIDEAEVTQSQFAECVSAGSCAKPNIVFHTVVFDPVNLPNRPVIGVAWKHADDYCRWDGKRLPTEAEWELAARGNDDALDGGVNERDYPWGSDGTKDCFRAWVGGCGVDTRNVGELSGDSPFGVQDMAGNVAEWVADWFDSAYYASSPATNPQGPAQNTGRKVVRGGGIADPLTRSYAREALNPNVSGFGLGFRCAK